MDITFDRKTVGSCLQQRFGLPSYQREYKWETKHLSELITDIQEEFFIAYDPKHGRSEVGNYPPYFLGTIITTAEGEGRRGIIDGQQRLTTLTLLFSYFQRKSKLNAALNISQIEPMLRRQVFGEAQFNIDFQQDRKELLAILLDSKDEDLQDLQERVDSIENITPSTNKMFYLFNEIGSILSDRLDANVMPFFIDYMMERVYLFEIGVSSEQDGHKVFVTMNDRGLKLSPIDLLKGHLLSNVRSTENNKRANQIWTETIRKLQALGSEEDTGFFKAWLRAQYATTSRGKSRGDEPQDFELIADAYHRWVVSKEVELGLKTSDDFYSFVVNTFPFFAEVYSKVKIAEKTYSEEFKHVFYNGSRDITLQAMVIMAAIDTKDPLNVVEKKIKMVSRFLDHTFSSRTIEGKENTYDNIRELAFSISKNIRRASLESIGEKLTKDAKMVASVFSSLQNVNYLTAKRLDILYLLARCAEFLEEQIEQTNSVGFAAYVDRTRGARTFDIEHILSNAEASSARIPQPSRNKIGALILLPRGRNRSLKAASYEQKLAKYATENILAQTLVPSLYENNPQLSAFLTSGSLKMNAIAKFDTEAVRSRGELYNAIARRIWNADDIMLEAR